jgi:hypothetical protein
MQVSANPNKKLCMANPMVRCFPEDYRQQKHGSIETLMEASIIHNIPAANHRVGELGIINNAAKIAPAKSKVFVPILSKSCLKITNYRLDIKPVIERLPIKWDVIMLAPSV